MRQCLPVRCVAAFGESRRASGGDVSGRMLLLRGVCNGMSKAGGDPAGTSVDESGEICAGEAVKNLIRKRKFIADVVNEKVRKTECVSSGLFVFRHRKKRAGMIK